MAKSKETGDQSRKGPTRPRSKSTNTANTTVESARKTLQAAREALRAAENQYEEVRCKATAQLEQIQHRTVGDVIDETLDFIRKHPGIGVLSATALGYFLGRRIGR
ncbi:MAG: hypothetical protein MK165_17450 [Pirellulaceae bacterium]|nr:hypothetical protein [Pirellulaceae bacterium]